MPPSCMVAEISRVEIAKHILIENELALKFSFFSGYMMWKVKVKVKVKAE